MAPKVVLDLVFSPLLHLSVSSEQHLPGPDLHRESCFILDLEPNGGNLFLGDLGNKLGSFDQTQNRKILNFVYITFNTFFEGS
jgi:hypothetical protein